MTLAEMLLAFVVAFLEGSFPVAGLKGVLTPARRKDCIAKIPEMAHALRAYDSGGEIDWLALAEGVRAYAVQYSKEPGAKTSVLKMLKNFVLYYKNTSEGALKNIVKLSSVVEDDYLQGYFTRSVQDQGLVKKKLTPIVRKLGGSGYALTVEESKEAKEKDSESYKEYLALRRDYNDAWKAALSNFVRESGDKTVKMSEALAHFKKLGIEHSMPTGFTGRIDANGLWYTMDGKAINGGAPSAVTFPTVRMNPAYDGDENPGVFLPVRSDGSVGSYAYTAEYTRSQSQIKYEKVAAFDVEKTRKRWLPMLKQFDPENPQPIPVAAIIMEILYRSSNRIGTAGGNASGGGFGICTLQRKHYFPQTNGDVKFIYLGKKNVRTVATVTQKDPIGKLICEAVDKLAEGKKPRDPLFTYNLKNGTFKPVLPGAVNVQFKAISGGVTVHKLRTVKGTKIFREFLDTLFAKRKTLDEKQVLEQLKKGAMFVGKELNHVKRAADGTVSIEPMTSLKNYIDPQLQVELFMHYGCPLPIYLEKLLEDPELAAVEKTEEEEDPEVVVDKEELTGVPSERLLQQIFLEGPESIV